jgi:hypothetical protein
LLAGRRFIDAVALAREAAWQDGDSGNTWAAYQCYGDPDWRFRRRTGDAQASHGDPIREEYEGISSPLGLALALEKLAVQARHRSGNTQRLDHLRHLEARFGAMWGGMGAVAEAFGLAYAEAGQREQAVTWYAQAVAAADASASIKAAEQWLNLRVRLAADRTEARVSAGAQGKPADPDRKPSLKEAVDEITAARDALVNIAAMPTLERLMLCGSACKHLAIVHALAQDQGAAQIARKAAADWYEKAEHWAMERDLPELFYPSQNRMATALASHSPKDPWPGFDAEVVARARASVQAKMQSDPDFWCMVAAIEIDAFEAVAKGKLHAPLPDLERRAKDLKSRMPAPKSWDSSARTAHHALDNWANNAVEDERRAVQAWLNLLDEFAGKAKKA